MLSTTLLVMFPANNDAYADSCGTGCDIFFQFTSCIGKEINEDIFRNCATVGSIECQKQIKNEQTRAKGVCEEQFKKNYSGNQLNALLSMSEVLSKYATDFVINYTLVNNASADEIKKILRTDTENLINFVFVENSAAGWDICKIPAQNYYIRPGSDKYQEWGIGLSCHICPNGGQTMGTTNTTPIFITSCYLSPGAFSDTTGRGDISDICPYLPDGYTQENAQDIVWYL